MPTSRLDAGLAAAARIASPSFVRWKRAGAIWFPDGRQIAYHSQQTGQPWSVFVVGANGGEPRRVAGGDRNVMDGSWSSDGTQLVVGVSGDALDTGPTVVSVIDLRSGRASSVPGSEHLFSPRWSPDGRHIVAVATNSRRLTLYDMSTRRWRDLVRDAHVGWPIWTPDGRYVQAQLDKKVVRIHVSDGRVTPVADLEGLAQVTPPATGPWLGMDDQGVPLALREVGSGQDIYALHIRVW